MNPRRIAANLTVDLKEFVRNKAAMFWTILFPLLLILLFGFIFQNEGEINYDLPIQDRDGGNWSATLTDIIKDTDLFDVEMVDPDLAATLAQKKIDEIQQTGADMVVTSCQQCVRTIATRARRQKIDLKVMDITDLIWETLAE